MDEAAPKPIVDAARLAERMKSEGAVSKGAAFLTVLVPVAVELLPTVMGLMDKSRAKGAEKDDE